MALNSVTGEHYSTYSEPVRRWTQECLSKYLRGNSRFRRILDIGCGTGENSQYIQQFSHAKELIGLDVNPNFLKFAERHSKGSGTQYLIEDMNGDWIRNEFRVNKFDLVFSSFALHWIKDMGRIFKEMTEVMEDNGESFHVIGIKPCEAFSNTLKQMVYHPKWTDDLEVFHKPSEWLRRDSESPIRKSENPSEALRSLLAETGHEVLLCKEVDVSYTCDSHEESKGMLEWLLPLTRFIPQIKMADFMTDAHAIFEKYSPVEDNKIIWKTSLLVVHSKYVKSNSTN